MTETMMDKAYHHGYLKAELLRLGMEALERDGVEKLSFRSLAETAGVSKTAPYRHFKDKETFLGALSNEGFRILHGMLQDSQKSVPAKKVRSREARVSAMGTAYMRFAVAHKTLYRLMNSPLACHAAEEHTYWAHLALDLLGETLAGNTPQGMGGPSRTDAVVSTWAYIHGLVLLRIDDLYPAAMPEPDWDRLAGRMPSFAGGH